MLFFLYFFLPYSLPNPSSLLAPLFGSFFYLIISTTVLFVPNVFAIGVVDNLEVEVAFVEESIMV